MASNSKAPHAKHREIGQDSGPLESVAQPGLDDRLSGPSRTVDSPITGTEDPTLAGGEEPMPPAGLALIGTDRGGKVVYLNRAAEDLYGWRYGDAFGQPLTTSSLRARERSGESPGLPSHGEASGYGDATGYGDDHAARAPRRPTPALPDLGTLPGRSAVTDRLRRALMGLPTREAPFQARESGPGPVVGVLICDIDRFRVVNDGLGHEAGDRLLAMTAQRLEAVAGPGATVGRLDADDFAVVLEAADAEEVVHSAGKLAQAASAPLRLFLPGEDHRPLALSVSVGVAIANDPDTVPEGLLRDADLAMHRAKASGGNSMQLFDAEMRVKAKARFGLEAELRRDIKAGRILPYFQPVVSLAGEIHGFEALARWDHPERGLLAPIHFVELAEETGLINALGESILRSACAHTVEWQSDSRRQLTVAVNVSGRQLTNADLPALVEAILRDTGLPPGSLTLELTETALMKDPVLAAESLRRLVGLGVRIAVDDFGTGYSSLIYLRRFPVQILKLDRDFVAGLGTDPTDAVIVGSSVQLAHALGLDAIAEGVETAQQVAALRWLACDLAQGYYWSRPLPAAEASRLVEGGASFTRLAGNAR